jgi:hypothetical protein
MNVLFFNPNIWKYIRVFFKLKLSIFFYLNKENNHKKIIHYCILFNFSGFACPFLFYLHGLPNPFFHKSTLPCTILPISTFTRPFIPLPLSCSTLQRSPARRWEWYAHCGGQIHNYSF